MARIVEVAHEGALRRGLTKVVENILEKVNGKYPGVCRVIAEPKYVNSCSTSTEEVNLLKILGSVHCVYSFEKKSWFRKKKKILLIAITEPELFFQLDGTPQVGNMRVYFRDLDIRECVLEHVSAYAEAFKIEEVVMVRDHILPPPKDTEQEDE